MDRDPQFSQNNSPRLREIAVTTALFTTALSPLFMAEASADEQSSQETVILAEDYADPAYDQPASADEIAIPDQSYSYRLELAADGEPTDEGSGSDGSSVLIIDLPGNSGRGSNDNENSNNNDSASEETPAEPEAVPEPETAPEPAAESEAEPDTDGPPPLIIDRPGNNEEETPPAENPAETPPGRESETPPPAPAPSPPPAPAPPPPPPAAPNDPNPDFTFPVRATREELTSGGWCYLDSDGCHHDYPAADMGGAPGTKFVSPVNGVITAISQGGFGNSATIRAQGGSLDGNLLFLQHMAPGSIEQNVQVGDVVTQGQLIGVLGTADQIGGSAPHGHLDMLPPEFDSRVGCSGASCTPHPFINVQPLLIAEFEAGMPMPPEAAPAPPPPAPAPEPAPAPAPEPEPAPEEPAPEDEESDQPSPPALIIQLPGRGGSAPDTEQEEESAEPEPEEAPEASAQDDEESDQSTGPILIIDSPGRGDRDSEAEEAPAEPEEAPAEPEEPAPTPEAPAPAPAPAPEPPPAPPEVAPAPAPVTPVPGARLSSGFGARWGTMHYGMDLAAPMDTPINMPLPEGTVIEDESATGFGHWVRIQMPNGDVMVIGHMKGDPAHTFVDVGDVVRAGDPIALVGSEGQSTGPHAHIEIWLGGSRDNRVDPKPYLEALGVPLPG